MCEERRKTCPLRMPNVHGRLKREKDDKEITDTKL